MPAATRRRPQLLRLRRRRAVTATPTRPVPTSRSVLGSGTGFEPPGPLCGAARAAAGSASASRARARARSSRTGRPQGCRARERSAIGAESYAEGRSRSYLACCLRQALHRRDCVSFLRKDVRRTADRRLVLPRVRPRLLAAWSLDGRRQLRAAGGKSGLHRARWWATPTVREDRESATEIRPPDGLRKRATARVKRRGKSSPRPGRPGRHGKPHLEEDRIGGSRCPRCGPRVGRWRPSARTALEKWPSPPTRRHQNPAYGDQALTPSCRAGGRRGTARGSRALRRCRPVPCGGSPSVRPA